LVTCRRFSHAALLSATVMFFARTGVCTAAPLGRSQGNVGPGPEAKACGLVPVAELEMRFRGKAGTPRGTDLPSMSICTVVVGGHGVRVQSAPPGSASLPTTVPDALSAMAAVREITFDIRRFGQVGCGQMRVTRDIAGKALARPVYQTVCVTMTGGYLSLSAESEDPRQVDFDGVRGWLDIASAARNKR
jgi:hypothetical protein